MKTGDIVKKIFSTALGAVVPPVISKEFSDMILSDFSTYNCKNLIVVGIGKASYQMAESFEKSIPPGLISGGILITKYGHAQRTGSGVMSKDIGFNSKIRVLEAGHPLPDENGLKATGEVINLLKNLEKKNTLIVCLISGGGSALFVYPYDGITLKEKQISTDLLLKAGADINELNAVRKHISRVKGGRFVEIAYPARIVSLIISDVLGDKLDVIASGPTVPDTSTFQDALNVIDKYKLKTMIPGSVIDILNRGREGLVSETPKAGNRVFKDVKNIIIGNNQKVLDRAKDKAQSLGFEAEIIATNISGEARDVGKRLAGKALEVRNALALRKEKKQVCLISGGETTVTVRGSGKGGRNTELALSFAREIEGTQGITFLSAGTDGTDGPTDAAGALVDGSTITRAQSLGLNPDKYLKNNDSYNFFKQIDSLFVTGPTGTNVMDVQILLVG
ncbi:MAG: glycerate kinase [Thermodesulfovibrionia bacterium]|nr:glycerate kinase [Thermodesulfovibrionia bacterium]